MNKSGEQQKAIQRQRVAETFSFAAMSSVPVLFGYVFLGIAFGILLQKSGYSWRWALASSLFVYAGSMQFLLVTLFSQGASLLYTAVMTFFVNGRHLFYGLSFVEKYRDCGKLRPYLIFSLTDETYSVLCGCKIPEGMDRRRVWFFISLLDQCYWILGSVAGTLLGQALPFNTQGIEFSMTALFVVILTEQWREREARFSAAVGLVSSSACLLLLGSDRFLLPALAAATAALLAFRRAGKGGAAS